MKGRDYLSNYNLLDEPWLSVITDDMGSTKLVSLKEIFRNAHLYKDLAGDTKSQDFVILRLLLSVLHTVYSRVDSDGTPFKELKLDESWLPTNKLYPKATESFPSRLLKSWEQIWSEQRFNETISEYLEKWRDRFYLFDEKYPFFQVIEEDIDVSKVGKVINPSFGRLMNRTISESNNKQALFAPRTEAFKNRMTCAEFARWLLVFQNYTGTLDKAKFIKIDYKVLKGSKGWLFEIGGIYLKGKNLFQTLMLNLNLGEKNSGIYQKPCWELSSAENLNNYFLGEDINNIAQLYTAWSRAVYVDPSQFGKSEFEYKIVKLPEVKHQGNFVESMTLWKYNKSGIYKNSFTPKKHQVGQSLWRSFGLITMQSSKDDVDRYYKPGIIDWLNKIRTFLPDELIRICSIGLQDDGNATSWLPINELFDELIIHDYVITDAIEDGWVDRLNGVVEKTKYVIDKTYAFYLNKIKEIRYSKETKTNFVPNEIEQMYFIIDTPFRHWLASLKPEDSKDEKILEWYTLLCQLIENRAKEFLFENNTRDYKGILVNDKVQNIPMVYNYFIGMLYKILVKGGKKDE